MTALPSSWDHAARPAHAPEMLRTTAGRWAGVALVAAVCLLPRVGFLARPFESDAGLYAYMGKTVADDVHFGRPYVDFYETKFPGVPLLTGALWQLFGDRWPLWVGFQTALAVTAALVFRTAARRMWGEAAATGAFWFALVFLNLGPVAYRGFQLETIVTVFAGAAGCLACGVIRGCRTRRVSGWAILAGMAAGVATMMKPTGAAVLGAMAVALLARGQWKKVVCAGIGFCIPIGPVVGWTYGAGLMNEMPGLWREVALYGSGTPVLLSEIVLKWGTVLMLCGFVFYVGGRMAAADRAPVARRSGVGLFLVVWLVLECIGVFAQKRMYAYHFMPLAGPLTLLFAALFSGARGLRLRGLVAALAPVVALSMAWSREDFRTLLAGGPQPLFESAYLHANARPGDRVVGDGIERLLIETGLRSGTRYAHLFYLANHDGAPDAFGRHFIDDLESNRPEWAVTEAPDAWRAHRQRQAADMPLFSENPRRAARYLAITDEIQRHIEANYAPAAQVGGTVVWRRK